jgi:fructose-1,6-bisphosphatase II
MVRVTEAAALAASRWVGKGDTVAADLDATRAMHTAFQSIPFSGRIVMGEGDNETVPHLFAGEQLGSGGQNNFDLAVDALECTRSVAFGRANAMSIVALAPRGCLYLPPAQYLDKLAVGPEAAGAIDITLSVEDNLNRISEAKRYNVSDLTVVMLDRERHGRLIERVRKAGARLRLISDGDVAAAIATATPGSGVDVLMGVGSATAGLLAAAALKCLGGEIQARIAPSDDDDEARLKEHSGGDLNRVYRADDLAREDNVMFAATGITDGDVLNGVTYRPDGASTHSMVLRSLTRTRRFIVTDHYFDDNPVY